MAECLRGKWQVCKPEIIMEGHAAMKTLSWMPVSIQKREETLQSCHVKMEKIH